MALNRTITSLLSMVEDADELIIENLSIFLLSSCNSPNTEIMLKIEARLRHALSELSKVANRWKTINRLPYELLVRIFDFVGRGVPMVQIARVCRHWRQLALRTPSLWSVYRFPDDEKWAGILWNGSQRFPLDMEVVIEWHTKPPEVSMRWIPLYLLCGKLRSLSLMADVDLMTLENQTMHIMHIFSSAASHLTKLSLISAWYQEFPRRRPDFSGLFDGIMPNLKFLTLHQIPKAAQFIRPGLQSLILSRVHIGDVVDFLHTLAGLPNLEILSLAKVNYSLPHIRMDDDSMDSGDEFDEFDVAQHRVELTRLRMFHIKDDGPRDGRFFDQYLLISPDCSRCYDIHVFDRAALLVDSYVDQPSQPVEDLSHLTLDLDERTSAVTASNSKAYVRYQSEYPQPSPEDHSIVGLTLDGLLLEPFLLKLTHVVHLIVRTTCRGSIKGWTTLFDQMPRLTHLRIEPTGHACKDLILAALSPLDPHTILGPCRAPKLETISIEDNLMDTQSPTTLAMMQFLENRFACGRPIQKLSFQKSASEQTERRIVARVQPFVSTVELFKGGFLVTFRLPEQFERLSEQLADEDDGLYSLGLDRVGPTVDITTSNVVMYMWTGFLPSFV